MILSVENVVFGLPASSTPMMNLSFCSNSFGRLAMLASMRGTGSRLPSVFIARPAEASATSPRYWLHDVAFCLASHSTHPRRKQRLYGGDGTMRLGCEAEYVQMARREG